MRGEYKIFYFFGAAIITLAGLFLVGWWFLSEPAIANLSSVTQVRNLYAKIVAPLPNSEDYIYFSNPFRILETVPGGAKYNGTYYEYIYSFMGKIEKIDAEKQLVYFRCCGNKTFIFRIKMVSEGGGDIVKITGWVREGEETIVTDYLFDAASLEKTSLVDPDFDLLKDYTVVWVERRTLKELIESYKEDPLRPVNYNQRDIMNFIRN